MMKQAVELAGHSYTQAVLETSERIWKGTEFLSMVDVTSRTGLVTEAYVDAYREGGLSGVSVVVSKGDHTFEQTLRALLAWRRLVEGRPHQMLPVLTTADLDLARRTGRLGIIFALDHVPFMRYAEPGFMLYCRDHEDSLQLLHTLGVRLSQLVYLWSTLVGEGAGEDRGGGLTDLGREVVLAMNRQGITIDIAHGTRKTCLDTIEVSEKPVLFTHGGCRNLTDHPRNLDDDVLRALGAAGGVFGVAMFGEVITSVPLDKRWSQPSFEDWLRHTEHAINVAGIDHVGFGPDFNDAGMWQDPEYNAMLAVAHRSFLSPTRPMMDKAELRWVKGMTSPTHWPAIFAAFVDRGYSEADIRKLMGGNFRRVLEATWK